MIVVNGMTAVEKLGYSVNGRWIIDDTTLCHHSEANLIDVDDSVRT